MGGLIPLTDASRRPARIPVVTAFLILVNALFFYLSWGVATHLCCSGRRSLARSFPAITGSRS